MRDRRRLRHVFSAERDRIRIVNGDDPQRFPHETDREVAASSPSSLSLEISAAAISLPLLITRQTHSSQSGLRNLRHHAGSEEAGRDTG